MKKHLATIVFLLVFLVGLGVLLYPSISDYINTRNQTRAMNDYVNKVSMLDKKDYEDILNKARQYNENLGSSRQNFLSLPDEKKAAYNAILRVGNSEVMGYIDIPCIDQRLPIYHGTNQSVLQIGVGHLEGSSLPIGGENSHSLLSAHRGLPSAKLFTNLDQVRQGDLFSIHTLNLVLSYEVDEIRIVEPHEVDGLGIIAGGDYVTLITCTPYGVNTHRLLVRGKRIYEAAPQYIPVVSQAMQSGYDLFIVASIAAALLLTTFAALILVWRHKTRAKTRKNNS